MGHAANTLMAWQGKSDCYSVPFREVRDLQVAAMNERLEERIDRIKLIGLRARDMGIAKIERFEDVAGLLLPHTAYKSYPESFLVDEKWDKLTKWLGTVSAYPTDNVDLEGIRDVDHWVERLEQAGHYVSCSSGTTGKSAMLVASKADMDWTGWDSVHACAWGTGLAPSHDRYSFQMAPVAAVPRNISISDHMHAEFGKPGTERFRYPVPPITVGSITRMIALRKAIAAGTAQPSQIAEYEETSAAREKALADAVGIIVDALLAVRTEKLYLTGLWGNLYRVAAAVRERGFSGKDFHPENLMYVGGGLKRELLPDDYREFVFETFNVKDGRNFQIYGMQEIGSVLARCHEGGRYHAPPWVVLLPLDKAGDNLLPGVGEGPVTGRAAFFDLSLDGRWGGVISGDRVEIDWSPCACGATSPSVADTIVRYADLEGDDKIGCAGTIDAYVRGMS
ncbi:MAG: hypothetical protein AB7F98_13745 [Novosphingobium sp.]